MHNYPAHHAVNGVCMLVAGAALQLQLFTIGTCLHRQALVIQVWIATGACCYLSGIRLQPMEVGGGGGEVERALGGHA